MKAGPFQNQSCSCTDSWSCFEAASRGGRSCRNRCGKNHIGSVYPAALKIPARRAEYSLTGDASSPFHAEPAQLHSAATTGAAGRDWDERSAGGMSAAPTIEDTACRDVEPDPLVAPQACAATERRRLRFDWSRRFCSTHRDTLPGSKAFAARSPGSRPCTHLRTATR